MTENAAAHLTNDAPVRGVAVGAYSDRGPKDTNEDSYGVMFPAPGQAQTKGIAVAIADGMSGCAAGKIASETCVKCLLEDYLATPDSWSVKKSAGQILLATNSWMYGQGQTVYGAELGMVSTLSALILKSGVASLFHIGDSRIYLLRQDGLEQLTTDHRYGRSHYLNRAMGTGRTLEIDYRTIDLQAGDVFILMTDGVYEFIAAPEISRLIGRYPDDLDRAAREICATALRQGGDDNLTCQVIRIDDMAALSGRPKLLGAALLPFPPPLEAGMILDGYEIVRELQASARSQVYLAKDGAALVALKTPSVNFNDDADYIAQFRREEWIGARIRSPHVVKVLPGGAPRHFLYYVTEYVAGQTLREWMNDHPDPDLARVRDILRQVIQGLRSIHRLDMVHRDIKPENIMIDAAGTVKIIDFGAVKVASLTDGDGEGHERLPVGAVDYVAPEYLLYGDGDEKSDLYSLGAVMYEMLTHKLPYGKGFATVRRARQLGYIPASRINPDIPPWIDRVLRRAVEKDPRARYACLSHFERDFTTPPPLEGGRDFTPLLEKNPLLFWQGLCTLLAVLLVMSLVA